MKLVRWILWGMLLAAWCLCASGCFHQRLLAFQEQLKEFEEHFLLVETEQAVALVFKKSVLLTKDTERVIGTKPTTVLGEPVPVKREWDRLGAAKPGLQPTRSGSAMRV